MKKSYLSVVLTMICLLGLREAARAQDAGKVVSNIPFDFVVGDMTLPAGVYTVSGVSAEAYPGLVLIRSHDKGALLLPIVVDRPRAGHAEFYFEHAGDKYFLSKIETPAGVYTFGTSGAITKVAQMKDHDTSTSFGAN
jgi:hypothetical protein